jgi:hypothetical protein
LIRINVGSLPSILELTMNVGADKSEPLTAIRTDLGAIFVSLELSRSSWLITSLSPGGGEKMSKHSVRGGDFAGLISGHGLLRFVYLGPPGLTRSWEMTGLRWCIR